MIDKLRLAVLVNWKVEDRWHFYQSLKQRVARLDFLQPLFLNHDGADRMRRLTTQLSEFYLPLLAVLKRKDYDVIISWSMRRGVCLGLLYRLCRPFLTLPTHILRDFHINLMRRDRRYAMKLRLLELAIPGIDYCLCTSRREEAIYCKMFDIPPERIRFLPDAPPREFLAPRFYSQCDYLFAYGDSDRDYDTLIAAVADLDVQVIILSHTYVPREPLPEHVTLVQERVTEQQLIEMIASARLVVLPLRDFMIAAGQNVMLEAMALGKPLLVTFNLATMEYAEHGATALFFPAGDERRLRELIRSVRDAPRAAAEMGKRARQNVAQYSDLQVEILLDVLRQVCSGP